MVAAVKIAFIKKLSDHAKNAIQINYANIILLHNFAKKKAAKDVPMGIEKRDAKNAVVLVCANTKMPKTIAENAEHIKFASHIKKEFAASVTPISFARTKEENIVAKNVIQNMNAHKRYVITASGKDYVKFA